MGKCRCVECDCNIIHEQLVNSVKKNLADEEVLFEMSDFFKVMSDSTRLKILAVLREKSLCVCDISSLLNMTKSAVSHQLQNLREMNLVKAAKRGKEVWYSLADKHVEEVFAVTEQHVREKFEGENDEKQN